MYIKITLLEKHDLFFFHLILELEIFFLFGNGIKQLDLTDFLKKLFNES